MIDLPLEPLKNNLFELDFSISKGKRVSTVKPSQEDEFFARLWNEIFYQDPCSFPYTKTLLKVSDHGFEKILHESTTLTENRPTLFSKNWIAYWTKGWTFKLSFSFAVKFVTIKMSNSTFEPAKLICKMEITETNSMLVAFQCIIYMNDCVYAQNDDHPSARHLYEQLCLLFEKNMTVLWLFGFLCIHFSWVLK